MFFQKLADTDSDARGAAASELSTEERGLGAPLDTSLYSGQL
jgi:hypothetical protein